MTDITPINELKSYMEAYARTHARSDQYRKSISEGLEADIEELSKEVMNPEAKAEAEKKAQKLEVLVGLREKKTTNYIKSNLNKILSETDSDKLYFLASKYKHENTKYKEFSDSLKKYEDAENLYKFQATSMGQSVKGFEPSKEEYKKLKEKYEEKTEELIKQNLRSNGKLQDEKDIEDMASVIFTLSGENYKARLIEKYLEKQKEKLGKDKNAIIGYITEGIEKNTKFSSEYAKDSKEIPIDNKYLAFGNLMYNLYAPQKQE